MSLFDIDLLKTKWTHEVAMYDVMCLLGIWPPCPPPPPPQYAKPCPPPPAPNILNLPTPVWGLTYITYIRTSVSLQVILVFLSSRERIQCRRGDCYRVKMRYFIRLYCLAVNSGPYSDMEECSSSSIQETWVRIRARDTLFGVTSLRTGQQDGT